MKKILYFIAALFVFVAVSTLIPTVPVGASGYVNQADIDAYQKVDDAVGKFVDEVESSTATLETVDARASDAEDALRALAAHPFTNKLGKKYSAEAVILKEKAAALAGTIGKASDVLERNNEAEINAYWDTLGSQAEAVQSQMVKVDAAVEESNNSTGGIYLFATIATGVLALGSFLWAFVRPRGDVKKNESKSRRAIAIASLWPFAGALITYISFIFNDGQYMILWGLVIFGLIYYIAAIIQYVTAKKAGFPDDIKGKTPEEKPQNPAAPIV